MLVNTYNNVLEYCVIILTGSVTKLFKFGLHYLNNNSYDLNFYKKAFICEESK